MTKKKRGNSLPNGAFSLFLRGKALRNKREESFLQKEKSKRNSMSLNKVMLIGRLADEPKVYYQNKGVPTVNLTLVTTTPGRMLPNGTVVPDSNEWHSIWLWDDLARTAEVDMVMFGRIILPRSYLFSLVLTVFFSLCVSLVMNGKLRRISMVESMKAPE